MSLTRRLLIAASLATGLASFATGASAQVKEIRIDYATYNPVSLVLKDKGFLEKELESRRELGYPPFTSLVRVLVHGTDPARVEKAAFAATETVRKALEGTEAAVLGPAIAPFSKLKGRTRWHLLVKAPSLDEVLPRLRRAASKLPADRRLGTTIDVDPQSLL